MRRSRRDESIATIERSRRALQHELRRFQGHHYHYHYCYHHHHDHREYYKAVEKACVKATATFRTIFFGKGGARRSSAALGLVEGLEAAADKGVHLGRVRVDQFRAELGTTNSILFSLQKSLAVVVGRGRRRRCSSLCADDDISRRRGRSKVSVVSIDRS